MLHPWYVVSLLFLCVHFIAALCCRFCSCAFELSILNSPFLQPVHMQQKESAAVKLVEINNEKTF